MNSLIRYIFILAFSVAAGVFGYLTFDNGFLPFIIVLPVLLFFGWIAPVATEAMRNGMKDS